MQNDPFSKLGALDQKLYQKPEPSPTQKTQEAKNPERAKTVRTDAHTHARTHTQIDTSQGSDLAASLFRKLQHKHHLSSYTFRFRLEELEDLTKLNTKLEKTHPNKLSKNDLVRLGVNWLLEDYETHGEASMLARILARV